MQALARGFVLASIVVVGCGRAKGKDLRRDWVRERPAPVPSTTPEPVADAHLEERALEHDPSHLELVLVVPSIGYVARVTLVDERFACAADPTPDLDSPWGVIARDATSRGTRRPSSMSRPSNALGC